MIDGILADAVVLLHLTFVLFVVFGGLLVMRYPWLAVAHAPAFVWGAYIEITGGLCPLTGVEIRLRQTAGEAGYDAGFIEHYIYPVLYPPGLTRSTQLWLAAIVLGLNGAIYGLALMRRMSTRHRRTDAQPHIIDHDGRA